MVADATNHHAVEPGSIAWRRVDFTSINAIAEQTLRLQVIFIDLDQIDQQKFWLD
jgi:hypothetical protein